MYSLRTLIKSLSFQSVCGNYQLIGRHSVLIKRSLKFDSILNKVGKTKALKISKRFLSGQELILRKRSSKVYPYPNKSNSTEKLVFVDNENQMAFKIIDSLLKQQKFELSKEIPVFNVQAQDVLDQFLKISPNNYKDFECVILDLVSIMKNLSLSQICDILESMLKWPEGDNPFSKLFYKAWSNVDRELESRLTRVSFFDNDQVYQYLYIGNLFYRRKIANISKFNYSLVRKLSSPDFELNKTSLVHLMFYINLHRTVDLKTVPFLLKHCEKLVNDMNLNEIGVICMTLFKTETKMSDDLAKLVIFRTLTDISEETDNIIRCAITKCLRRSANIRIKPQIQHFLNEMKNFSDHSVYTLTHLLNLSAKAAIYEPRLMENVFERVWSDPTAFRVKDIERIFSALSNFDIDLDENKLKSICDELHQKSEQFLIYQYPMCLLNIIHYLSIFGHYPQHLIQHCFEPNFMAKILKTSKLDFQRHLLTANTALSVERYEEFKEILLPPEKVFRYFRWILTSEKGSLEYITKRMALINAVYMTLKSEFNQRVQLCHIFPFKSYPLVVIYDQNNRHFSLSPKTELKANMFDNCLAIYILDLKDFAVVDTLIRGSIQLELRLLRRMGFKVVTIPWHHLTCFNTSNARKNKLMAEIKAIDPNFNIK